MKTPISVSPTKILDKVTRVVRSNKLSAFYSPTQEVSFNSIMTGGPALLAQQLADEKCTTYAIETMEIPELVESYPVVGAHGTRGCQTLSEHGASISDGLHSRVKVGYENDTIGVLAEGDTDIVGHLQVRFDSLLHGFLTVKGATELMDVLLVHKQATFLALTKFMDKVELHGETMFFDKANIDSFNLRINKQGAKDFVKRTVSEEMKAISPSEGPLPIMNMVQVPDEPPAKDK